MGLKPYLRLTRAHTVPLEAVPAALGAALALGELVNFWVWAWFVSGVFYHLSGYGMNSLMDWDSGHDKHDPHKQHHPLNSGTLSREQASKVVRALFAFTAVYTLLLVFPSWMGAVVMVVGIISGVGYNALSKSTVFKPIPIGIAHTTMFVLPYVSLGGEVYAPEFILASLAVFTWVLYQIGISGEIKDVVSEEETNILTALDLARVRNVADEFYQPREVKLFFNPLMLVISYTLKGITIAACIFLFITLGGTVTLPYLIVFLVFSSLCLVLSVLLVKDGEYNRDGRIFQMSMIEFLTLVVFAFAFAPVIGHRGASALVILSALWVLVFNKLEWDTWVAPEV